MTSNKPNDIDDYIARFPQDVQNNLNQVRATIKRAAPAAQETISYAIPTFKLNGRYLVYFAAYKNHISIYPAPRGNETFKELSIYKGGKGTVQFPLDKPMPLDTITKIVKFRLKQTVEKSGKNSKPKKK